MDTQTLFQKKVVADSFIDFSSTYFFCQKVVRYDLYVTETLVNYAGKEKRAIAINGQIPMPTLTSGENAST